ncbi:MAG: hypothetical protein WEB04_11205 [Dehalococcoidia bacterium]
MDKDAFMAMLAEKYESDIRPIDEFMEEEAVPNEIRAELTRILKTVLLLKGAAGTFRKRAGDVLTKAVPLQPDEVLSLSPEISRLAGDGFRFVVKDPETGKRYHVSEVEVEASPEDQPERDRPYRMAAF